MPATSKVCSVCKVEKPLDDFYKQKLGKYGKNSNCKKCHSKRVRAYQRGLPRERRQKIERKHRLLATYGITVEQYQQMWDAQNGCCAICGKPEDAEKGVTGKVPWMAVDHNHFTGKVRALLCNRCNRAIGFFADDSKLLRVATEYLEAFE